MLCVLIGYADGTSEFWDRIPTGQEFILQTVLGLNHGAVGEHSLKL
jgi:hypothetical protein